jgi:hypothetical protein
MAKMTERRKSTTKPSHDEEWRQLKNYTDPGGKIDWEKYRKDRAGYVPDPLGIAEHVPSDQSDWRNYCSPGGVGSLQ